MREEPLHLNERKIIFLSKVVDLLWEAEGGTLSRKTQRWKRENSHQIVSRYEVAPDSLG